MGLTKQKAAQVLTRDIFLGFVKVHILYHADKEGVYGTELMEELARHGYDIGPGTIYPTLHKLHQAGLLRVTTRKVDGKIRKYYYLTRAGRRLLIEAKKRIKELVHEVLKGN